MNKRELEYDLSEIIRIFTSAKFLSSDFKYLNSIESKHPIVYSTFYSLIDRLITSTSCHLVIELSKLLFERENFCLGKFLRKLVDRSKNENFQYKIKAYEFQNLLDQFNAATQSKVSHKVKAIRDEYYAHYDRNRTNFNNIKIKASEFDSLIYVLEIILKTLELRFYDKHVSYDLSQDEMGHKLFERLDQWEKYREKYGLLNY